MTSGAADEEWTTDQVRAYLAEQRGRPISADTWASYVSRGQAPKPHRHVGRTPLWNAAEIREWNASRRRPPEPRSV